MLSWVDHASYFGPDRRRKHAPIRVRERRQENYASRPPSLSAALRQLRMHVLEAQGPGAAAFAQRAKGVSLLADIQNEGKAGMMLARIALTMGQAGSRDLRTALYDALDRVQHAMAEYH